MEQSGRVLSTLGTNVKDLFRSLLSDDRIQSNERFLDVQEAADSFDLWAVNLGLYQRGHSSLDYRFQDASLVADLAFDTLEVLQSALIRCADLPTLY